MRIIIPHLYFIHIESTSKHDKKVKTTEVKKSRISKKLNKLQKFTKYKKLMKKICMARSDIQIQGHSSLIKENQGSQNFKRPQIFKKETKRRPLFTQKGD